MKVLYLTFYYQPDLCAGSFRNTPLVDELSAQLTAEDQIDVYTTFPNRYKSFRQETKSHETSGNISVRRIKIPDHKSGFRDQIKSFRAYYKATLAEVKNKEYDLVFASSSRLFTAYLGYKIAKKKNIPLYLDIRDIFVDTIADVVKSPLVKAFTLPVLKNIERKTFKRANHINLISEGFKPYFDQFNVQSYSFFTNGIDAEFTAIRSDQNSEGNTPKVITYAGNIGEGQGLHKIIPKSAQLLGEQYLFRIIGDGGIKSQLVDEIKSLGIKNVEFIDPVPRSEVVEFYKKSDFLFIHLNDYEAFRKVLPSKVFEYGATDKPIIAGVSGHARSFIEQHVPNHIVFSPGNAQEFATKMKEFEFKFEVRDEFIEQFGRKKLMKEMAQSIINTAQ